MKKEEEGCEKVSGTDYDKRKRWWKSAKRNAWAHSGQAQVAPVVFSTEEIRERKLSHNK